MVRDFEFDMSRFHDALETAAEAIAVGAKRGLHDALDDWKRQAVDIAPIDKATLRRGINAEPIEGAGLNLTASITANATEKSKSGGRFNYAYYIHEQDAGGKKLRHQGTVKKFLDEPAEQNAEKWMRGIEQEIEDELKRKRW